MDKNSVGIINFEEVAEILNQNLYREGFGSDEKDTMTYFIMEDLIGYFKKLSNTDFDEKKFKRLCLK